MKHSAFIVAILIAAIIQATLLSYGSVFGVKPDCLLLLAVIGSLFFDFPFAVTTACICGVIRDIFGVHSIGIATIVYPSIIYGLRMLARKISFESDYWYMGLVFLVNALSNILLFAAYRGVGRNIPPGSAVRIIFFEAVFTSLFFWVLVRAVRSMMKAVESYAK